MANWNSGGVGFWNGGVGVLRRDLDFDFWDMVAVIDWGGGFCACRRFKVRIFGVGFLLNPKLLEESLAFY